MAWWMVGFSIVASETSTLTFISVPGLAYRGNMHFLQLSFGYFVGRLLVSVVFIPAYFEGDLETAYDFLGRRYGLSLRKAASSVFLVTRVLASGVRLFATAIPVHLITGLSYPSAILLIGASPSPTPTSAASRPWWRWTSCSCSSTCWAPSLPCC
jgi:Na+/proline symporter